MQKLKSTVTSWESIHPFRLGFLRLKEVSELGFIGLRD